MLNQPLDSAVIVRFFMPSVALAPYVSTYYLIEGNLAADDAVEDWLHPEWANLRFSTGGDWSSGLGADSLQPLAPAILTGPTSRSQHFRLTGTIRSWGVGLLPLGWLRLIGAPAHAFVDRTVAVIDEPCCAQFLDLPAAVFSGSAHPAQEAQQIDAFLLEMLERNPPHEDETRVYAAHRALVDEDIGSVSQLAERLGMSSRSLERLSLKAFGFSPKLLLRRQRFLRSLAQFMLDPSLTWIRTLDFHYVDQAHFVRDFRSFMGMSPRRYGTLNHPVLRAAAQGRTVAAGAAVQALHRP